MLLHGQEDFCIRSERSSTDFPEVVFDWDQVAWVHSYFNPAVIRILIVWIVGHAVFQQENQTILGSKAHKPK